MRALNIWRVLIMGLVALVMSLGAFSPAANAGQGLKPPKDSMFAIYVAKGQGFILLNRQPCPDFLKQKVTHHGEGVWYFGHEYHSKTRDFVRLCWTSLPNFTMQDGSKIEEPVVYVQYAHGGDGVLEMNLFKPYDPTTEHLDDTI